MIAKNKLGREIEISVGGKYSDDIQITEAYFVNSDDEVAEDDIEYIQDKYSSEIYDDWFQNKVAEAEYYGEDR